MSNWLELRAAQDAVFDRDGAELWRILRDAICAVVDSFNAIYCSRGTRDFECSECAQMSETCVRIRSIPPPGQHEPYVELRFKPEQRAVALIATKGQELVFGFSFEEGTNILRLTHKDQPIIPDAASKLMLEPFLFDSGSRSSLNPPAT